MSDTSQGDGWWRASDGKWYGPELYPKDWPAPEPTREPAVAEPVAQVSPASAPPGPPPEPWTPPAEPEAFQTPVVPPITPAAAPEAVPPSGWAAPDPAAGEPTLVHGIAPVASPDATAVHQVVSDPTIAVAPQPLPVAPVTAQADWAVPTPPPALGQPEVEPERAPADIPAGLLGLLGGAVLVVGSFLPWAQAGGTLTSGTVNGLTGSNGWGTLVAGLFVAGCAGLLIAGIRDVWVGAVMGMAAAVGAALAGFSYVDIASTSDDLPGVLADSGVPAEVASRAVLDYDIGIWLVLAGSVLSLMAAVVALLRHR